MSETRHEFMSYADADMRLSPFFRTNTDYLEDLNCTLYSTSLRVNPKKRMFVAFWYGGWVVIYTDDELEAVDYLRNMYLAEIIRTT